MNVSDKSLRISRVGIPHAKNATWPVEKKIEAVTTHLALGNLRQVAAVTGVSYGMIKQWRSMPWWKDLEAEIIASRRVTQANKLSKIVDKSLDVIDDRLENGDFIYNNKSGKVIRKPVNLKDATSAANALMQRAAIIEKLNRDEVIADTAVSIHDQLKNLAEQFALMNNRSKVGAVDIQFKETNEQTPIAMGSFEDAPDPSFEDYETQEEQLGQESDVFDSDDGERGNVVLSPGI